MSGTGMAEVEVDAMTPDQAYEALAADPDSRLVDVRTAAEWTFVGLPDLVALDRELWTAEWVSYPSMARNQHFVDQLESYVRQAGTTVPSRLFFICRSGARSLAAAQAVAATLGPKWGLSRCTNVAEGFEGDLDVDAHRSAVNGWKKRGLPWRQG